MQCTFFLSAFQLILNLSNLIRFNLDQAVSAILFMCSIQEHVLDMVAFERILKAHISQRGRSERNT